jgi:hypothetical protein
MEIEDMVDPKLSVEVGLAVVLAAPYHLQVLLPLPAFPLLTA